ncbi:hypothetical protein RB595_007760 [Gaeumannomyces hyphopodioides]
MDDPSRASGAQKVKGQPRDGRKKAMSSRDSPSDGPRPAERGEAGKAGKAGACSATDLLSELLASMPSLLPGHTSTPRRAAAEQPSRPATGAGALKELRWWIPQWDEQVIGRMAFASLGFHHRDLSRPPEPERLTDPRLQHAFHDCAECRLTWLTGFNRLRSGGPGTQCTHPWHYACGRDNEDLMVDGAAAAARKSPQRPPMSSIVVRIGAVPVAGGGDDDNQQQQQQQQQQQDAAAFGVWFAEGSPFNIAEAMPSSSSPPPPGTGDRAQQQANPDRPAAAAASKEAVEIAAATRALEVLEAKVLPAYRARQSLLRRVPKQLSDLSQATDLVWARLQGVDRRLFAREVGAFEEVAREMEAAEFTRFEAAAPGGGPGGGMTIVGKILSGGATVPEARAALAGTAARLLPRLKDINRRLDDHHYVLMDECQRRTADAARQMGITDAGRPPSAWKLRKWMDKRDAIVDDYLAQMQRTMGPDAHKMQTHYVRFMDNAESSWVEPWLRNSLGGLVQAPLPSPRDVLSGSVGGGGGPAPRIEYDASSLLFHPKPTPASESPVEPAAAAPSNPLREAVLRHNARHIVGAASSSAAGPAEAASASPGGEGKGQDRTVDMRVILVSDSQELVNSVCSGQEGWRLAKKPGRRGKAGGIDSFLRDGSGRAGRNTAAWLRLWVAITRLRALAGVEVVWYAVPREQNGDAVRLALSAMGGKGKESM